MPPGNKSCRCPKNHKVRINNPDYPLLNSLLIILLPKCPFCIMAYTSAITVCSTRSLTEYSPQWTSWISISFTVLTLIIVIWNYKGIRTILASLLILSGLFFIIQSELISGLLTTYYWGCVFLFTGIWVNGSLLYFVRMIFFKWSARLIPSWPR